MVCRASVWRVACSVAVGLVLLDARTAHAQAQAQPPAAPVAPAPVVETPTSLAILSLTAGVPLGSAEERLLELDGYSGARYTFGFTYLRRAADQLAIGPFVSYTTRSSSPEYGGPDLGESTGMGGGQLAWMVGGRASRYLLLVSARAGAGYGATGFHSVSDGHWGLAWGGEFALLFPTANFGAALGFMSLQVPGPGALGRDNNLGSAYGSLELLFDG